MRILSVNVGDSQPMTVKHQSVHTGIFKVPAAGAVPVTRFGLEGDVRIELREMGLEHSAVYAYPHEHYAYWQRELGREPFSFGYFGENLTVTGLLEDEVRIGDVFRFGTALLQVAHPRIPCAKLNVRMGCSFAAMFLASGKVGYYFRVLREGAVAAGDSIELIERDENSPTMEEFVRISKFDFWDAQGLRHLLQSRDLMAGWREKIETKLKRTEEAPGGWFGLREFEVVQREQEAEDMVSLYLRCIRGRPLPPFRGGQQLVLSRGKRSASQQRQAFPLSGNPLQPAAYRITLRYRDVPGGADTAPDVAAYLAHLEVGEHVMCNAPLGAYREVPDPDGRIPLLLGQGTGIASLLSLLYELEGRRVGEARLLLEADGREPQGLLRALHGLLARNPGFRLIPYEPGAMPADAALLGRHVVLERAALHVAGEGEFVDRWLGGLAAAGVAAASVIALRLK